MLSKIAADIGWEIVFSIGACLFALLIILVCIRRVGENERLAVFISGHFLGFKGPGLVFAHPVAMKCYRVPIGADGELAPDDLGRFGEIELPVRQTERLRAGERVRITGFEKFAAIVETASRPASDGWSGLTK